MTTRCGDWFRRQVIDRAPLPFLTNAHELFLAIALFAVGAWVIVGNLSPTSVQDQVPLWMEYGWAGFLVTGSAATVVGLFRARPRVEWAGQLVLAYGCAFYAVAVGFSAPLSAGGVIVVVFSILAVASWWRSFKITSTPYVRHRIAREARAASMRCTGDR